MHSLFLNNIGRSASAVCRDAAEKPAVQGMAEEKAFSVLTFLLRFDTMKKTSCSEKGGKNASDTDDGSVLKSR